MLKSNLLIVPCIISLSLISIVFLIQNYSYADNFAKYENKSIDLEENNYSGESDFSFGISDPTSESGKWSAIRGQEVKVRTNEKYFVVSNMALNKYAVQSHITIEGFNETSESWIRLSQCPHGLDGPLKLTQFVCKIVIQPNIIKIRPVFESGWTSKEGEKALTVFEKFLFVKEPDEPEKSPILFDDKLVLQKVFSTHLTTSKMKFLGADDILLIDEPRGLTYRLLNGTLIGPLLDSNLVGNNKLVGLESIKEHKMNKVYLSYFGPKRI